MSVIWFDVDTALAEVAVNMAPIVDAATAATIKTDLAYNAAGLTLFWHFVSTAGAHTTTAVTPTTAGNYDWAAQSTSGIYTIEIPASGGASINNDTEGFGYFTGVATGFLPWRSPTYGFRAAVINNALIDSATGLNEFADALLKRDLGLGSNYLGSVNERTVMSALRLLRNYTNIVGGTLTVRCENDSTTAWTAGATATVGANPITSIDPA